MLKKIAYFVKTETAVAVRLPGKHLHVTRKYWGNLKDFKGPEG